MPDPHERLSRLPGWELVAEGLSDVARQRVTPAACLVWMAAPRLRRAGLLPHDVPPLQGPEPELQLYRLLRLESGNSFGRYQALLRRLVRFEHALDREWASARSLAVAEDGSEAAKRIEDR